MHDYPTLDRLLTAFAQRHSFRFSLYSAPRIRTRRRITMSDSQRDDVMDVWFLDSGEVAIDFISHKTGKIRTEICALVDLLPVLERLCHASSGDWADVGAS